MLGLLNVRLHTGYLVASERAVPSPAALCLPFEPELSVPTNTYLHEYYTHLGRTPMCSKVSVQQQNEFLSFVSKLVPNPE